MEHQPELVPCPKPGSWQEHYQRVAYREPGRLTVWSWNRWHRYWLAHRDSKEMRQWLMSRYCYYLSRGL